MDLKISKVLLFFFTLFFSIGSVAIVYAQADNIYNQSLRGKTANSFSDQDILNFHQKMQSEGQNTGEIITILTSQGMAEGEAMKISERLNNLLGGPQAESEVSTKKEEETDPLSDPTNPTLLEEEDIDEKGLPIFGRSYFSRNNIPVNLEGRIPTPQNYIVGPNDELAISVYGSSVVNWNLRVDPEGTILLPGIAKLYVGGHKIEHVRELIKSKLIENNFPIGRGSGLNVSLSNIRTIRVNVNGEVRTPGTYIVSSLSTILDALHKSGGPNRIGSMRTIELIRNNTLHRRIDLYDFFLRGDKTWDITLQDDDIILVQPYRVRVGIQGEVKRPAIYEVMPGESFRDIVHFSGGFTPNAYTEVLKVIQLTKSQKRIKTFNFEEADNIIPLKGDQYFVDAILDRFENRVTINGAVFRPGDFELQAGLTINALIELAGGLKQEAFLNKGYITRLHEDNTSEIITFNLEKIRNNTADDIVLKKDDVVSITSIFDLNDGEKLTIIGSVRNPGGFSFDEKTTVSDLILKAGGFSSSANMKRLEIARRVRTANSVKTEIIHLDIDHEMNLAISNFVLQPHDILFVYDLPGYEERRIIRIEGEVNYPGYYALTKKNERISDILHRARGFTEYAYLEGASLRRETSGNNFLEEEKIKLKTHLITQETTRNLSEVYEEQKDLRRDNFIGLDLKKILENTNSHENLILQNGDVIYIPEAIQTIRVSGEVLIPSVNVYKPFKSFKGYINSSGGFAQDAFKRKSYVIYPNGSVASTKTFLFFRSYPKITPGSEIIVPIKVKREGNAVDKVGPWVAISTSLATMGAVVFSIINMSNNSK